MKTIAISIEETTLDDIDRIAERGASAGRGAKAGKGSRANRSLVVRRALEEFIAREQRMRREEQERVVFGRHRETLARQAAALVDEQAKP